MERGGKKYSSFSRMTLDMREKPPYNGSKIYPGDGLGVTRIPVTECNDLRRNGLPVGVDLVLSQLLVRCVVKDRRTPENTTTWERAKGRTVVEDSRRRLSSTAFSLVTVRCRP
jgi:hypothetical protein